MTGEEALEIIKSKGAGHHDIQTWLENGVLCYEHIEDKCEFCQAVGMLEWIVVDRRRHLNETDLNASW